MPNKGANELNESKRIEEIEEKMKSQLNGIKALIEQDIISHIPKGRQEEIEVLGISYSDYLPLGEVDYKGLNCIVDYQKTDKNGNVTNESIAFSLDENGMLSDSLAKIDQEGLIELTDEFREKLRNAGNAELVEDKDEKYYLTRKDGKLHTMDEEEKQIQQTADEEEKEEIAQSYRKETGRDEDADVDILSITEIENPEVIGKILEIPMQNVNGKYKFVRFKDDIFMLMDDTNNIVAGIEVTDLARDIHDSLNIRLGDTAPTIEAEDLEVASTVPGRYNVLKVRNEELDDTEFMITYNTKSEADIHLFERSNNGNLTPIKTNQKFPPKIVENGEENRILPQNVTDLSKLIDRQRKLEKALELQKTIEAYQGKSHILEAAAGASVGAIEGMAVGTVTVGSPQIGGTIGATTGAVKEYKASKENAEETIKECETQRDAIFAELEVTTIEEAELENKENARYLGDHLDR